MPERISDNPVRVGFFNTVPEADAAVRNLLAAGFSKEQIAVICPERFKSHFAAEAPLAEHPGSHATRDLVEGGALGAAIGGITLAAATIATGGAALLPAIPVLIGGGALAGGLSSFILSDGYGKGVGEYYEEAVHLGKIVVGVEAKGEDSEERLADAERILTQAGGQMPLAKEG